MFTKSYRAGALLSSPHGLNMDQSLVTDRDMSVDRKGWEQHFNKFIFAHKRVDIPKPCMYEGRPHWIGGLEPSPSKVYGYDEVWISDFQCEHILVFEASVYPPTVKEYKKHFLRHVEQGSYKILFSEKDESTRVKKNDKK